MNLTHRALLLARPALALATCASSLLLASTLSACSRRHDDHGSEAASAGPISPGLAPGACTEIDDCERRCDGGEGDPCRRAGDALEFARDGGRDETRATAYYERACDLGDAPACLSAGHMFEYHRGVVEDDARAADYYKRGCDKGHVPSCANYAIMVENGRGVARDGTAAIKLYRDACNAGAGLACDRLGALSRDAGAVATPAP